MTKVEEIRVRLRKAVEEHTPNPADPPPRYDEVWEKGLEWLERNETVFPGESSSPSPCPGHRFTRVAVPATQWRCDMCLGLVPYDDASMEAHCCCDNHNLTALRA